MTPAPAYAPPPAWFPREPRPYAPLWFIERADGFEQHADEATARRKLRALRRKGETAVLSRVVGSEWGRVG